MATLALLACVAAVSQRVLLLVPGITSVGHYGLGRCAARARTGTLSWWHPV